MKTDTTNQLIETFFKMSRFIKGNVQNNKEFTHLSMLQLYALLCIKKKPNIPMREIAACFRIELPSATSLVNKLHSMELVERQADPKDRRIVRINLTEKGQQLCKTAILESNQRLEKLFSNLSENDKKELLRILTTLTEKIEDHDEK